MTLKMGGSTQRFFLRFWPYPLLCARGYCLGFAHVSNGKKWRRIVWYGRTRHREFGRWFSPEEE